MKKIRVAINGFGRIGRAFYKIAKDREEIEVVAINDIGDIHNMAYLLKYDTVYGKSNFEVKAKEDNSALVIDGKEVAYLSEKDGTKLPWNKLEVDVVVESTGLFTSYEKSKFHLEVGAKRVVISAPAKDEKDASNKASTILLGVNEEAISECKITSNASCTTNAISPVLAILNEKIGVEKAILNTVHGYTASQEMVDGPNKKDWREGRAGAMNIIPSSTGAAKATAKAITDLKDKFDGISVRVPVVAGSVADVTFISKRETSVQEINEVLKSASEEKRWKDIFAVTEEELVSSDIIGDSHASVADLKFTRVVGGNLVKVLAWYDNEMGYTYTLVEHVIKAGRLI